MECPVMKKPPTPSHLAALIKITVCCWLLAGTAARLPAAYPDPPPINNQDDLGRNLQRTMSLLESSTPTHRNTVKILFYGQSITDHKPWVDRTIADLRSRFPNANIIAENRAIGGFASQRLINTAEHDLYPFYPDLLVFHVYGAHDTYENIIRYTRARTTCEILICNDHITGNEKLVGSEYDGGGGTNPWTFFMDNFTRQTAQKYGAQLLDVREYWTRYLIANSLEPSALLKDNVHMNTQGDWLLGELVKRELVYRADFPSDPAGLVEEVAALPEDFDENGVLDIPFNGNRVDLVLQKPAAGSDGYEVRIDGAAPSTFPGVYTFTRPKPDPWSPQTTLNRVDSRAPRLLEDWTLTVDQVFTDYFTFSVEGSLTGFDGEGRSDRTFISESQQVVIDQDPRPTGDSTEVTKWFGGFGTAAEGMQPGKTITWRTEGHFTDQAVFPSVAATEATLTLAQGIPPGNHLLRLTRTGTNAPAIEVIRFYRPSADRIDRFWLDRTETVISAGGETVEANLTADGPWTLDNVPSWLQVNRSSGTGSTALALTAPANRSGGARTASLLVKKTNLPSLPLEVIQEAVPAEERQSVFRAPGNPMTLFNTPFGWIYDGAYPWVYGWEMGWFYVWNDDPEAFFFYLNDQGWAFSGGSYMPFYYIYSGPQAGWKRAG